MREREDVVATVLEAAGGQLTGRVRLQKSVYLLDRLGFDSKFSYDYHHYGPYSRDLDNATADAKAFCVIEEIFVQRQNDGATYSIFRLTNDSQPKVYGKLDRKKTQQLVHLFAATNVTVLELAVTVDWLWRFENYSDWRSEIVKRKGVKVQEGRLEKALKFLGEINLEPPRL